MSRPIVLTVFAVLVLTLLTAPAVVAEPSLVGQVTLADFEAAGIDVLTVRGPVTFADTAAVVEAFGTVRLENGTIGDGQLVRTDARIMDGLVVNRSTESIELIDADGREIWIEPGMIGQIGFLAEKCSVSCNSGYYACCNDFLGECECNENGSSSTFCNSGGAGSNSCSIDRGQELRFGDGPIFE
ncbi:MAG: hypothetical protein AAGE94_24690 [Acidobacteriota bacterium]